MNEGQHSTKDTRKLISRKQNSRLEVKQESALRALGTWPHMTPAWFTQTHCREGHGGRESTTTLKLVFCSGNEGCSEPNQWESGLLWSGESWAGLWTGGTVPSTPWLEPENEYLHMNFSDLFLPCFHRNSYKVVIHTLASMMRSQKWLPIGWSDLQRKYKICCSSPSTKSPLSEGYSCPVVDRTKASNWLFHICSSVWACS